MNADDELDRIDRAILRVLQAEGRLTNQALASRVGLSPSACLARVRHLERTGAIQGYHARLDPYRLGIGLVLFVEVTLDDHRPEELERFEAAIAAFPEVVEASHVSGDVDYVLKVVVADMPAWTRLREKFIAEPIGASRITTHVLMRKPKVFVGYPVSDR
ncbi:Lrp/AsnC family transcriptional regulator [Sphingosinicella sp. LY1275]|uniref:Lrp/AsnC family transcriptional regulator n=1 Tax=Sphingosinicella sp. LY1275 TaxID=3095379 RepID=UPI002ADEAE4D|nr:Lrp/AsnC family transcriptional regulator [Sphingosinicella sp. LY1275]MEA1013170.1 Lrp/AsnC family transcriptional regulator [Sphingosinicella sp. LY1275]